MSPPFCTSSAPPAPRDQAVAWHVRLASDAAEDAHWLAFEAWLARSAAHRAAYDAVEAVWQALDRTPA